MDVLPIITTVGSIFVGVLGSAGLTTWLNNRAQKKKVDASAEVDLSSAMLKWQETLMTRILTLETEVRACHDAHIAKDREISTLRIEKDREIANIRIELDAMKASLASKGVI